MAIIIGGDIVPVETNTALFERGKAEELIGTALSELLRDADLRIFNLETPLTDQQNPIGKNGPHLCSSTMAVNGIKAMGIDLLTLGNNHIMDQDADGLLSTINTLDSTGIMHLGAGKDLDEAQKPFHIEINGKRYGIYACVEHEFSTAGENKPGANPFDSLETPDHIAQLKSQCDYAIVLYHGGKEQYRYPSPNLQKTCRKLIEKGADLVICQHSHCIGCKEEYLHGKIIYGQGNFLFDHKDNDYWKTGLLISISDSGEIDYIPIIKEENKVRLATDQKAEEILKAFHARSEEILRPGFVQERYNQLAESVLSDYILFFRGINIRGKAYRIINKLTRSKARRAIVKSIIKKRGYGMRNYIECESHRELFLQGLERFNHGKAE